jgi:hypothetical protein
LPNPYPAQAVPTGLATNGNFVYSAELSGFPFVAGSTDIYRTDATGTTSLLATGLAVDARGRVDVANNGDGTNGELLRLTQEVPGPLPILGLAAAFRQARRLRRRIALQAKTPEARLS